MAVAANQEIIGFDVAVDVAMAMDHLKREQKRRGVEFCGVVGQDILTLRQRQRQSVRVLRTGGRLDAAVPLTCSRVMKSPPGRYSKEKYRLSLS